MNTPSTFEPRHVLRAGFGFNVSQDFARAAVDLPAMLAPAEYCRPGQVIAYIKENPEARLGFLKYGHNGLVRICTIPQAIVAKEAAA